MSGLKPLFIENKITKRDSRSVNLFLQEMGKEDLLSPQEEIEVVERMKRGDEKAREILIKANLRFVVSVAKQYASGMASLSDLISEGTIGLIKAAECFDNTRGFKFISYAVWWIRQSIMSYLSNKVDQVRTPQNRFLLFKKVEKFKSHMEATTGVTPSFIQISDHLGIKESDVRDILKKTSVSSLDLPLLDGEEDSDTYRDRLTYEEDDADAEDAKEEDVQEIKRTLLCLDAREKQVICWAFGIGDLEGKRSNTEIARELKISNQRVEQIRYVALRKMRKILKRQVGFYNASLEVEGKAQVRYTPDPFLIWAGGKRKLAATISKLIPKNYTVYREPFLGSGAMFFYNQPSKAVLSDLNKKLIVTYQVIQNNVEEVIEHLSLLIHSHTSKECYYENREKFNQLSDDKENHVQKGALFLYLNRTCFNGLYRENRSGGFNSPVGTRGQSELSIDEGRLLACSKMLADAEITFGSYDTHKPEAPKEFYYLDPPYDQTYSGYTSHSFNEQDHADLAEYCREVDSVGSYFMLSNSNTGLIRRLYKGFIFQKVKTSHSIAGLGTSRGAVEEVLITNY